MKNIIFILFVALLLTCRSLVTTFNDSESAIYYTSSNQTTAIFHDSLKVMTWNIRFGAGRIPWFEDSCGDRVLMTETEIINILQNISLFIDSLKPDIILLQEVDISSKRSAYIDQMQWLLDNTYFNFGIFASMWEADMIPSGGLGKVNVGNAILSRWEITNAERIKLSLRTDQWALKKYFYLRRNILKGNIIIPESDFSLYAVNIHATAFATDNTKQNHIDQYIEVLKNINDDGEKFITGGDLNALTPWVNKRDYCEDDRCEDDICDGNYETNTAYEGTYFEFISDEKNLLRPLYSFYPAIDSLSILSDDSQLHTHSPWNTDNHLEEYWDRKLDYLFTNYQDWSLTATTHNDIELLSDHAPVSAILYFNTE